MKIRKKKRKRERRKGKEDRERRREREEKRDSVLCPFRDFFNVVFQPLNIKIAGFQSIFEVRNSYFIFR